MAAIKGDLQDTDEDILWLEEQRPAEKTQRDWMEWQANAFAAAVLMPRRTIAQKTISIQVERGVRNFQHGVVFRDNQLCNYYAYSEVQSQLCETYRVSKQAMEIRLKRLQLLTVKS